MPFPSAKPITEAANKRVLLCEGYDDFCVVASAHVRQGSKVWVAFGDSPDYAKQIMESAGGCTIVESMDKLDLVEGDNGAKYVKDGVWIVEGPSQRSDTENRNKRKYKRKLWERIIGDPDSPQQKTIKSRGMVGHFEHPADGRMDGREGALIVVESKLRTDGVVWNKYELLDTPNGKILQEYTRKRVPWGVSSRGSGSIGSDGTVSESDFWLETWDAVMRPSTHGAYPTLSSGPEKIGSPAKVQESAKADVDEVTIMQKTEACLTALVETDYRKFTDGERFHFLEAASQALQQVEATEKKAPAAFRSIAKNLLLVMAAVAKPSTQLTESQKQSDKGIPADGFSKVIELLRHKTEAALVDVVEAQQEVSVLKAERAALQETCNRLRTKVYLSEEACVVSEHKLQALAAGFVAGLVESETDTVSDTEEVKDTATALTESFPELTAYSQLLQESETVLSLVETAVRLLTPQKVTRTSNRFGAVAAQACTHLADLGVVSESVTVALEPQPQKEQPPQLQAARAMVRARQARTT